mmetsp:Transcript_16918/g.27964  ORF Transcript_16918/g.27964 Transcript_16918/m.27964 type:complete len:222 (-) Transcript_16918:843-1508(-)
MKSPKPKKSSMKNRVSAPLTLVGTGFRRIPSISKKSRAPPSSPGIGSELKNAILMEMRAAKENSAAPSDLAILAPTATTPTGPATLSDCFARLPPNEASPWTVRLAILWNSFEDATTASFTSVTRLLSPIALGERTTPNRREPFCSSGTTSISIVSTPRLIFRCSGSPLFSSTLFANFIGDCCDAGKSFPSTCRITSPALMPASDAAELISTATWGTATPG